MEKILNQVSTVLFKHYGIEAKEKIGMAGYESSNLKVKSPQGNWVVKFVQKEELPSFYIQNKVLLYAKSEQLSFSVPLVNNKDEYFNHEFFLIILLSAFFRGEGESFFETIFIFFIAT